VDSALLLGLACVGGGLLPIAWRPVLVVAAGVLGLALALALRRRRRRPAVPLALAVIALGAFALRARGALDAQDEAMRVASLVMPSPVRCAGTGTVATAPVRVRGSPRWNARVSDVTCEGTPIDWRGMVTLYGGPAGLARGDVVDIVAQLAPPQRMWNEALDDPRPGEARRGTVRSGGAVDVRIVRAAGGALAAIDRARAHVRARIDATFPEDAGAMARALVLGESDLAPEDDLAFRASGLAHLLAVSGMHLILVVAGAVGALRGLLVRVEPLAARLDVGRVAAALGVPATWAYSELAGASGSTLRAAWMMTAVLLARALGRRTDAPRALGLSMVAMACVDPLAAFDVSFVLSAGATGGLLAFSTPLADLLASRLPAWTGKLTRSIGATLAATLPCAPLLARFAPTLPLGGVAANLIAVPIGELIALPMCLAHALLSPFPLAERGCAVATTGALRVVREVARRFAAASWLSPAVPTPTGWQMAAIALGFAWLLMAPRRSRAAGVAVAVGVVLLLEVVLRAGAAAPGCLRVTFLDVGQGDAALLELPDGDAILIDGGGLVGSPVDTGTRVIAPVLRARRRDALAVVVLSHPHPDHFSGLASGLDGAHVGALWDSGQGEREGTLGGYAELLAHARRDGVPVLRPPGICGAHEVGGVRIEVLAPCPDTDPDRGANDNSVVVRVTFGARAFLFVGDAEGAEERDLLRLPPGALRADVLKVGHHGSRTSSSAAFLQAVRPGEAVISVGARNRFGHPNPWRWPLSRTAARACGAPIVTARSR
jgi:competence protein ComEC